MADYGTYSHLFRGSWSIHNEEKPSWDSVKTFLSPGCVFLDIGCQKGIYSQGVIDLFGEDCVVYGFDVLEHPEIKKIENSNSNFTFINSAVGDGISNIDCVVHYDTNTKVQDQSTISIDDFCFENNLKRVDFIKIDVDGCETSVLSGMTKTLQNLSPVLMIEIEDDFDSKVKFLENYGYKHLYNKNDINRFFSKQ